MQVEASSSICANLSVAAWTSPAYPMGRGARRTGVPWGEGNSGDLSHAAQSRDDCLLVAELYGGNNRPIRAATSRICDPAQAAWSDYARRVERWSARSAKPDEPVTLFRQAGAPERTRQVLRKPFLRPRGPEFDLPGHVRAPGTAATATFVKQQSTRAGPDAGKWVM